jgi:alanine racemase
MSRSALAVLSTHNLLHNVTIIKARAPNSAVLAMVKANAYGHGLRSVALRLESHVASLGVASLDEAMALRKVGVNIPITLMEGVFSSDELLIASCQGFHIVVHQWMHVTWLESLALPEPVTVWIKIDTGMGRLGFFSDEFMQVYDRLRRCSSVNPSIGSMSHFACADDRNHPLNQQQIAHFCDATQMFQGRKSLCNSAALFTFIDHQYDVVRPGLALYGVSPIAGVSAASLGLKPVMTLQSRIMAIRMMRKGSLLGYGARFVCPEDMPVGVIALGYGDGYPRTARDGTPVLINGVVCPLIGRVSMDMMTVDLRGYPQAKIHDQVILWGQGLPLETVAPFTHQSPYDLLTGVQSRVKFYWTAALYGAHT